MVQHCKRRQTQLYKEVFDSSCYFKVYVADLCWPLSASFPLVVWPTKATPGMWSRCTYAALKGTWSGSIPRGPSSSTSDLTRSLLLPPASLSALNPPQTPVAPTSTWTVMASCGCCCLSRTRLGARSTALVSRKGRSSSRPSRTWISAGGSQRFSTS